MKIYDLTHTPVTMKLGNKYSNVWPSYSDEKK